MKMIPAAGEEQMVMMMIPLKQAELVGQILKYLEEAEFEKIGPEMDHFGARADNMAQYSGAPSDPFNVGLMD